MTFEKVKEIIVDTLSCDEKDVTMQASLSDDLDADSLDAVELNMALEDAFGVSIPDVPGGMNRGLDALSRAGVNIEYRYAFLGGKDSEHAYMIFRVADAAAAATALTANGIAIVSQEEISQI